MSAADPGARAPESPISGGSRACPILTFHMLGDRRTPQCFPPKELRDGLRRLASSGYRSIDLLEAANIAREGRPFPARSLVLTFDDGYASVHEEALPLLVELGWSATMFVIAGSVGGRSPEGWRLVGVTELSELREAGVSIGAHTVSHRDLTTSSAATVSVEMAEGKARLEALLGSPVRAFAYPFGRFDARSRSLAEELYECACTDVLRRVRIGDDPWLLPRIDTWYLRPRGMLGRLDSAPVHAYLAFRRGPRALRRRFTCANVEPPTIVDAGAPARQRTVNVHGFPQIGYGTHASEHVFATGRELWENEE